MSDLSTLIEKLSAATEGSWELDLEIAEAVGFPNDDASLEDRKDATVVLGWYPTRSIDVALKLVPKGYLVIIWINHGDGIAECFPPGERNNFRKSTAATEPLSLCIAALRAREAAHA